MGLYTIEEKAQAWNTLKLYLIQPCEEEYDCTFHGRLKRIVAQIEKKVLEERL